MEDKIGNMINDLLKQILIVESESGWNALLVVVPKKNGDLRLCVDFRKLNSRPITIRPQNAMANIQEMFDTLQGNRLFSTLGLSKGYLRVSLDKNDAEKTGFSSRSGHYHFKKIPFGSS